MTWQTKLLAFDGNGPIYVDAHCPECGRAGRRATITARDLDENLVNDEEIADIGQERIYTFLFLITQMFDPADRRPEKQLYPVLTAEFIARNSCQRAADVERHMIELHEKHWFDVALVTQKKYKVAFGKPWASWGKNATDRVAK